MSSHSAHARPVPDSSAEALLHRMERVRELAGQLVRQAADRDDIVQEAVARALARPREIEGDPDPWIRRVVKNLVIDRQRAASRRQHHEDTSASQREAHESAAESVERAERQRDLVSAVLQLKEPYRAVILHRFFDGLPPREIAKRRGVPVATVKKQQERGMAMLRKELETRYGGGGGWAVALLPIVPNGVLKSLAGGSVLGTAISASTAWALTAGVVALAIVGAFTVFHDRDDAGESIRLSGRDVDGAARIEGPTGGAGGPAAGSLDDRSPASLANAETTDVAARTPVLRRVFTGTFVDESGAPVDAVSARCRVEGSDGTLVGPPVTGSSAGVVVASIEASPGDPMIVEVEAAGFAPATFRFQPERSAPDPDRDGAFDVGMQTLFRAVDLAVRVVDDGGSVLFGWEMSYFHYGGGDRLDWGRATADPVTGRAIFGGVPATEVEIIAKHPSGLELHHPRRRIGLRDADAVDLVYVGPDPARRLGVELVWPAMVSSHGGAPVELALVTDGQPIAALEVPLGQERAAFEDVAPGDYTVAIDDRRFEPKTTAASPGGAVRMELAGNAVILLSVGDAGGRPVREYTLELGGAGPGEGDASSSHRRVPLRPTDGRIEGLLPERPFTLRLSTGDGGLAACEVPALLPRETRVLHVTLGEGVRPVEVVAHRGGDAEPVAGASVAVFDRAVPRRSELEEDALALVAGAEPRGALRLLATGETDARGRASLPVAAHELTEDMTALVVSSDHGFAPIENGTARVQLPSHGAVRVRLEGLPAGVTGAPATRLDPATGLPWGMAITLTSPGSVAHHRATFGPGIVLAPDADGAFVTALAPEGDATVWLAFSDFNHTGRGTTLGGVTGPVGYPLGTTRVTAGGTRELEVDVAGRWPGSLDVALRHAGQPLHDAVVELEPAGSHGHLPYPFLSKHAVSRVLTRMTDGVGRAQFARVPAGRWRVRVRDREWLWVASGGEVEIASGQHERVQQAVELAAGEVLVVDAPSGAPLRERELDVEMAPGAHVTRSTDGSGRLRLRLGPGTYRITVAPGTPGTPGTPGPERSALLEWGVDGPLDSTLPLTAPNR